MPTMIAGRETDGLETQRPHPPMRVCIVSEFFYPDMTGGTGMLLSDLARSLHDDFGVEIDVITTRHLYRDAGAKLSRGENWNGITISRVSAPNFNRASMSRRLLGNLLFTQTALLKLLSGKRYDLVLTATAPPTIPTVAHLYQKLTGIPYVYIIYDLEPDRVTKMDVFAASSRPVRLLRGWQQTWLNAAAKVVVIGRCMRDYLGENYALPAANVEVIAVGADANRIVPADRETNLRRRFGLDGFVVLYAGNFGKYHNFNTIIDAAKKLHEAGVPITFALFGNGAQEATIRARIESENIENVKMFPILPQSEVAELFASADVSLVTLEPNMEGLCVPSKFYPILASGRPTIALVGEKSEIAHVLREADCGVRLDQGDTDKLVATLAHLVQNPAEAERMGHNARRVLEEKYSTRRITSQYYDVLKSIALKEKVEQKSGAVMASHD